MIHGDELIDPFFYFHNETILAVTPLGEPFDNATHPTIITKSHFSVNKFMNLEFNKAKINNMSVSEIDNLA